MPKFWHMPKIMPIFWHMPKFWHFFWHFSFSANNCLMWKNNWCLCKKNSWAQNIHFYVSDAIFLKEESYWLLKKIEVGHLKSTYRPHEFFLQGNNFFTKKKFSFNVILILRLRCFRAILDLSGRKSNVQEIQFYLLGVHSND